MSAMRKARRRCCRYCGVGAMALLMLSCVGRGVTLKSSATDHLQTIVLTDSMRVDTIDFGRVRAGEVVERTVALENKGVAPLVIVTTDTSCGCLELDYVREPISAGEKSVAKMTFYSSGYNYFVPRAFYIVTSATMGPKKIIVTADME